MPGAVLNHKLPLNPKDDLDTINNLKLDAIKVRRFILELGFRRNIRLHYGAIMSVVEILTLLYQHWMSIDPAHPSWEKRDRFILSKGHAAPALYVVLALSGYFKFTEFDNFRTVGSRLQGHPDRNKTPGVECCTGSLGQGFPVACGMALASKTDGASYKVYACISDGECNEGSIWEAALIASNLELDNLIVLIDWNKKSSYGLMKGRNDVDPLLEKWRAFKWATFECDGHDFASLSDALSKAEATKGKPSILLCNTIKGKGIPWAETVNTKSNFYLEDEHRLNAIEHLNELEHRILNETKN